MRRELDWWELRQLEHQGCRATDWNDVEFQDDTDLLLLRNVEFRGKVRLGRLSRESETEAGIYDALIEDCRLGDDVYISRVGSRLKNLKIGNRVRIENVGRIEIDDIAFFGIGTEVGVLDETGTRPVWIYPGLSSQTAMLAARKPTWGALHFKGMAEAYFEKIEPLRGIDDDSVVRDAGIIINVWIGKEVTIEGASRLVNGTILNNAGIRGRSLAYVGQGVDAENFIIEDATVSGGAFLRNVYVGQGAIVDKGFTAHDSLIFSNSALENGEACAVFAGPYTVSMHKSTLLIGAATSFMNAGSGTNQSNHMYKLGPVHWGLMERGVKTSSGSYIMWGAKIGAFSLLMGSHKNHPDSSDYPFSYLFGDAKGATTVVPGRMLRSCGLMRDEMKWPTRDRRQKRKLEMHDRVHFSVLNPYTVDKMLRAIDEMKELLSHPADDDLFMRHKGMKFRAAHLDRAINLYTLAIMKYLDLKIGEGEFPESDGEEAESWIDLGGQMMPRPVMEKAMESKSLEELEGIFDEAYEHGDEMELAWIGRRFDASWRGRRDEIRVYARQFDQMLEDDRVSYRQSLDYEQEMLDL